MDMIIRRVRIEDDKPLVDIGIKDGRIAAIEEQLDRTGTEEIDAEGRVAHVGRFDALEDQMCAFGSDGTVKGRSPDRADALVWAITDLLLDTNAKPSVRML